MKLMIQERRQERAREHQETPGGLLCVFCVRSRGPLLCSALLSAFHHLLLHGLLVAASLSVLLEANQLDRVGRAQDAEGDLTFRKFDFCLFFFFFHSFLSPRCIERGWNAYRLS